MPSPALPDTPLSPSPAVLITGGQGDLGQAIARQLSLSGLVVDAPGRQELDVASAESVENWMARYGRLDLVVHSAGVLRDRASVAMEEPDWDTVMDVNLKGAFRVSQAALRLMAKQRQGHLVFIGSNSARWGTAGQSNYAAAKAGIIALTHSLAKEYGSRNIRVNCVLPGLLETKMTRHLTDEVRESVRKGHALGRFNDCAAVARFIDFLHRELPHTSGQVFQLDSRVNRWT